MIMPPTVSDQPAARFAGQGARAPTGMMSKIRIRSGIVQQKRVTHTNIREEHHHSSIVNRIKSSNHVVVFVCVSL